MTSHAMSCPRANSTMSTLPSSTSAGQQRRVSCDDHWHRSARLVAAFTLGVHRMSGRTHNHRIWGNVPEVWMPPHRHGRLRHRVPSWHLIVRDMSVLAEGAHALECADLPRGGLALQSISQDSGSLGFDFLRRDRRFDIVRDSGYATGFSTVQNLVCALGECD